MSTKPTRKRRIPTPLVVMAPVVFVIVYVLSLGPLFWMATHGRVSIRTLQLVQVLFVPLAWLGDKIPWVEYFLDWYMRLWAPS